MGSVTNSLTSTANTLTNTPVTSGNSNTSGNTNTTGIFTGTSAYSNDFQNIISRQVAIASLPIALLTNQQNTITNQSNELKTLDTKFAALQTAIQGISTAINGSSYQSTSSAPTAVTATLAAGATEGVYNIQVDNPGVAATSLSTVAWNPPPLVAGQKATYGLMIGNQEYNFTTSDNSAQGVAAAITAKYGSLVNALAVNVGANNTSISLQSTTLGPVNLNILQVPTLQTQNSYAISQTTSAWVSTTGSYNLKVNGIAYAFMATGSGSAADVAADINATATARNLNVKATVAGLGIQLVGTTAGSPSLDISNSASTSLQTQTPATSETTATWNAAADSAGTRSLYTLDVGAGTYNFTVADNSAQTVAAAINSNFGTLVNATVVDLTGSGDYRIALQAKTGSSSVLDLQKTTNLETPNNAGYAVSQTTSTWASTTGTYNLVVNGTDTYSIDVNASDSAQTVADAINAAATTNSLAVKASVVNLGTLINPDNRIQLVGTTAAVTSLDIQNGSGAGLQTAATCLSGATWDATPDAANKQSQYTLVVGTNTYNFVSSDNTPQTVAAAINSQFSTLVNATVVDLGTGGSHDYRIALQDETGTNPALAIQKSTANSLQTQKATGQLALYELDGAAQASSNTASINVATGVTLNLLKATTGSASITVTQSSDALSTALSAFADAYNACVDEINGQRGQSAGPLQGQSILTELSRTLSGLSTYGASSGSIGSLVDLGFELDRNGDGHLTYTATSFTFGAGYSNIAGVDVFLGVTAGTSSATGTGFLGAATNALLNLQDNTVGLIKTGETALTTRITNIGTRIAAKQAQVDNLQTQLTKQLAASDALIAAMEQQYSYLSSMFAAQQTANQQYK